MHPLPPSPPPKKKTTTTTKQKQKEKTVASQKISPRVIISQPQFYFAQDCVLESTFNRILEGQMSQTRQFFERKNTTIRHWCGYICFSTRTLTWQQHQCVYIVGHPPCYHLFVATLGDPHCQLFLMDQEISCSLVQNKNSKHWEIQGQCRNIFAKPTLKE